MEQARKQETELLTKSMILTTLLMLEKIPSKLNIA